MSASAFDSPTSVARNSGPIARLRAADADHRAAQQVGDAAHGHAPGRLAPASTSGTRRPGRRRAGPACASSAAGLVFAALLRCLADLLGRVDGALDVGRLRPDRGDRHGRRRQPRIQARDDDLVLPAPARPSARCGRRRLARHLGGGGRHRRIDAATAGLGEAVVEQCRPCARRAHAAVAPPMTTPTRRRPSRTADAARLKPEARV